jgi:YVTN family beta-propeller protein
VVNYGSNTVTPITVATSTAGTPIKVGKEPFWVVVTPNGKTA